MQGPGEGYMSVMARGTTEPNPLEMARIRIDAAEVYVCRSVCMGVSECVCMYVCICMYVCMCSMYVCIPMYV